MPVKQSPPRGTQKTQKGGIKLNRDTPRHGRGERCWNDSIRETMLIGGSLSQHTLFLSSVLLSSGPPYCSQHSTDASPLMVLLLCLSHTLLASTTICALVVSRTITNKSWHHFVWLNSFCANYSIYNDSRRGALTQALHKLGGKGTSWSNWSNDAHWHACWQPRKRGCSMISGKHLSINPE